jgi:hypothetical protein
MGATHIRVSEKAHRTLTALSREVGAPVGELVDQAVELLRRQRILDAANAAYAVLRSDPAAAAELEAERAAWDATLADGLEERGV